MESTRALQTPSPWASHCNLRFVCRTFIQLHHAPRNIAITHKKKSRVKVALAQLASRSSERSESDVDTGCRNPHLNSINCALQAATQIHDGSDGTCTSLLLAIVDDSIMNVSPKSLHFYCLCHCFDGKVVQIRHGQHRWACHRKRTVCV